MKKNIILAGVGGQGILSIAAIIGATALHKGLYIKQSEVHGMSQRGGDVQSNLRISDKPIYSDLVPEGEADVILSVEPMEVLRYKQYLKKDGWLISNNKPFNNIADYPALEGILDEIKKFPNHILIDADSIAKDLGSSLVSNVVMIGAASDYLGLTYTDLEEGIRQIFGAKGQGIIDMNLKALEVGHSFAKEFIA